MEGDAGTSQLNPTDPPGATNDYSSSGVCLVKAPAGTDTGGTDGAGIDSGGTESAGTDGAAAAAPNLGGPADGLPAGSRLGRGWVAGICVTLLVAAAALAVGGYLALRAHSESVELARSEAKALAAARDCVSATQAPDTAEMLASQQKILDCSTGDFAAQSSFYGAMVAEAYQASKARVQVVNMRAAVEKHNDDGSVEVLVAVRVKVSNTAAADQVVGYRLRLQMALVDGNYRIAKLDQVSG